MLETNLHPLINPDAPGIPEYSKADINPNPVVNNIDGPVDSDSYAEATTSP
jgi:hypothetical protein